MLALSLKKQMKNFSKNSLIVFNSCKFFASPFQKPGQPGFDSNKNTPESKREEEKDLDKDLGRLGNDWKSDPNQQEESKIKKAEKAQEENKRKQKDIYPEMDSQIFL